MCIETAMHERRPFLRSNSEQQSLPSPASQEVVNGSTRSYLPPPRQLFDHGHHRKRPSSSFKRTILRLLEHLEEERPVLYYTSLFIVLIGGVFVVGVFAGKVIGSFTDDDGPPANNNLRSSSTSSRRTHHPTHQPTTYPPTEAPTPEPVHTYKLHFPDIHMPKAFKKNYDEYNETVSKDKEICFVHVGKTAGSTVGCALGFGLHCKHHNVTPGLLPQYTTREFHSDGWDCFEDSAYYMFVVRDPLDRLVSAFNYEKPSDIIDGNWSLYEQSNKTMKNVLPKIYHECFDNINDLGQFGLSPEGNATEVCKSRASAFVEGTEIYGTHHFYNYQFHLEGVPENATIMTIRQTHLVDDWNAIEHLIGGEEVILGPNQTVLLHRNVHHAANATTDTNITTTNLSEIPAPLDEKYLSNYSRSLICEKLCNEIQVYKKILSISINLSEEEVGQTIEELKNNCPLEAEATTCASVLPDITEKLIEGRGYDLNITLDNSTMPEIAVGRRQISLLEDSAVVEVDNDEDANTTEDSIATSWQA